MRGVYRPGGTGEPGVRNRLRNSVNSVHKAIADRCDFSESVQKRQRFEKDSILLENDEKSIFTFENPCDSIVHEEG